MSELMIKQAIDKLDREVKEFKGDRYGNVVYKPTAEALKRLCRQNARLASAIVAGGNLTDCIKSIGIKGNISDLDVYAGAVKFYMPGYTVQYSMEVVPDGSTDPVGTDAENKILKFDLTDLF